MIHREDASLSEAPAPDSRIQELTTALAVTLGLLMGFAAVVILYLMGDRTFSVMLGCMLGVVLFGLTHYLLWGRAMMKNTARERAELLAQDQAEIMTQRPWDRQYE